MHNRSCMSRQVPKSKPAGLKSIITSVPKQRQTQYKQRNRGGNKKDKTPKNKMVLTKTRVENVIGAPAITTHALIDRSLPGIFV